MKVLIVFLAALSALTACGPQQTSNDKDKAEIQTLFDDERAKYAPLAGKYSGFLKMDDQNEAQEVMLVLSPITQVAPNNSRFATTGIPTLGGNMSICVTVGDHCFSDKTKAKDDTISYPVAPFTSALYDPNTNQFSLSASALTTQFSGSGGTGGATTNVSLVSIEGTFKDNEIKGIYSTTLKRGVIDLKKVK